MFNPLPDDAKFLTPDELKAAVWARKQFRKAMKNPRHARCVADVQDGIKYILTHDYKVWVANGKP